MFGESPASGDVPGSVEWGKVRGVRGGVTLDGEGRVLGGFAGTGTALLGTQSCGPVGGIPGGWAAVLRYLGFVEIS